MFKRHRYPKDIILQAVYFKSRFSLSYRDIEELFRIRGVLAANSLNRNTERIVFIGYIVQYKLNIKP